MQTINIPDPAQKIVVLSKSVGQDTVRITIPVGIVRREMERHGIGEMERFAEQFVMQIFPIEQEAFGFRFVKKSDVL